MDQEPIALPNKHEPSGSVAGNFDEPWISRGEVIDRYTLHARIASGGMASVYLGSLAGAANFSRLVAIKRMHPQYADDPEFAERFRDEALLTARLQHPNIVQSLDVVQREGELLLVMEYVDGVTLNAVCHDARATNQPIPLRVITGIMAPVLHGLHAAHIVKDDDGNTLGIVHRDFSPQNIIIGCDGNAKILDFGIAKARSHHHVTATGQFSGKFGYLSPEQLLGKDVDQRTDIFAAGVVLWELLSGRRLFREPGLSQATTAERVLNMEIDPPSRFNPQVDAGLDAVTLRALQREPEERFETARALAVAIEAAHPIGSSSLISSYVQEVSGARLERLSSMRANVRRHVVDSARKDRGQVHPGNVRQNELGHTVVSIGTTRDSIATELMVSKPDSTRKVNSLVGLALLLTVMGMLAWARLNRTGSRATFEASVPETSAAHTEVTSTPLQNEAQMLAPEQSRDATAATTASALPPSRNETLDHSVRASGPATRLPQLGSSKPVVHHSHAATEPSRPAPKPNCNPPTYIDSEGIRHFKAGCL